MPNPSSHARFLLMFLGLLALLTALWGGPYYDAMLHTVFVGFVLAMIFGHAPIILPAILGQTTSPYHPAFYAPLGLLHASLLLRTVGDLVGWWPGRRWGGLFNAMAVLRGRGGCGPHHPI